MKKLCHLWVAIKEKNSLSKLNLFKIAYPKNMYKNFQILFVKKIIPYKKRGVLFNIHSPKKIKRIPAPVVPVLN